MEQFGRSAVACPPLTAMSGRCARLYSAEAAVGGLRHTALRCCHGGDAAPPQASTVEMVSDLGKGLDSRSNSAPRLLAIMALSAGVDGVLGRRWRGRCQLRLYQVWASRTLGTVLGINDPLAIVVRHGVQDCDSSDIRFLSWLW